MSSLEERTLGYSLKLAQLSLKNLMEEKLRPLGVTLSQYAVLAQLDAKGGQTNAELARNAFITAQSMQGVLSNLETLGLIERKQDQEHGRRQPAALTTDGKRILACAREVSHMVEIKLAEAIAPIGTDDALALFRRVHTRLSTLE